MKTTLKVFLTISLFCSIALADGNQGSGGRPGIGGITISTASAVQTVISVIRQHISLGF
jgi:hypothetical protein